MHGCLLQHRPGAIVAGAFFGVRMIRKHIDPVELRGDIERDIADVLDAVGMSAGIGRMEVAE